MKQIIISLSILLFYTFSFSQREDSISYRLSDIDQNGVLDTIKKIDRCCYDPTEYLVINGSTGEAFNYYHSFYFKDTYADFLDIVPIDHRLLEIEHKPFLDTIETLSFKKEQIQNEPSLDFLIHAYKTQMYYPDDSLVYMSYDILDTMIYSDDVIFPDYGHKLLKTSENENLHHRMLRSYYGDHFYGDTCKYFWINYIGRFHDDKAHKPNRNNNNRLDTISVQKDYVLLKTAHGVIQRYADGYRWIYINNGSLTGGPEKLRWASIKMVYEADGFVFIIQDGATYGYYNILICDLTRLKVYQTTETIENWCSLEPQIKESKRGIHINFLSNDQFDEECKKEKIRVYYNFKKLKQKLERL